MAENTKPKSKPSVLGSEEGMTFCEICGSPREEFEDACTVCIVLGYDSIEDDPEETLLLDI